MECLQSLPRQRLREELIRTVMRHRTIVPSSSGHVIAYRWRSLPRFRRHRANSPQGSSINGSCLLRCCHSNVWADAVLALMPFKSEEEARTALDQCWSNLNPSDYLEAIAAHPAIGDKKALRDKFAPSRSGWEGAEQAAAAGASEAVLDELAELNKAYMDKNGFVFLVCATGKPADTILAILKARLPNDRDTEIRNAVEEQRNITQLRFTRLLEDAAAAAAREVEGSPSGRASGRQWNPCSRL